MQDVDDGKNPLGAILVEYGWPHKRYFAVGLLAQILGRLPQLLPAFVLAIAFDAVIWNTTPFHLPLVPDAWIPDARFDQFLFIVAILALAYPVSAFFGWLSTLNSRTFVQRFLHDLRTDAYDEMQRVELAYFEDRDTGDIMSILNNDVNELRAFVGGGLQLSVHSVTVLVAVFGYMAMLNWQLALVLIVVPVFDGFANYWFSRTVGPQHEAERKSVGTLNSRLQTNVDGIATVKVYAAEDRERDAVEEHSRDYYYKSLAPVLTRLKVRPLTLINHWFAFAGIFLLGGYWVVRGPPLFFSGTLTAGTLFAFLVYVREFNGPMRNLVTVVDQYESGKASARRIAELVSRPAQIPEHDDPVHLEDVEGAVSYENVSFAYGGGESVIEDVSFDVEPGETIGIVGPTGAGKTTLVKLLMRLYDANSGSVRIDGVDVRDASLASLRGSIGYVSQDPFLFNGSVSENIAYGTPDVENRAVERAAMAAGADEFIQALPEGYETTVGERGVKLSGGQRQRVCIARALLKDPPIVVLDEATSHVDNETEVLIQRSLDALTENRTTFAVAHRLSTVRDADTILVMEDGRIVERGAHDELLEADGRYAALWNVQVGDFDAAIPVEGGDRSPGMEGGRDA